MGWTNTGKIGDVLLCPDGHEIADVAVDFSPGTHPLIARSMFTNWRKDQEPAAGAVPKCAECGQLLLRSPTTTPVPGAEDRRPVRPGLEFNLRQTPKESSA